jgi:hypothetical protein
MRLALGGTECDEANRRANLVDNKHTASGLG